MHRHTPDIVPFHWQGLLLLQEKGNNNAQWWQGQILNSLGYDKWKPVGLRQLSGMLVMVFSLTSHMVKPLLPL